MTMALLADKSALGAINRPLLVRLASCGAGEITSEAIWIDANRSNEARRTTTLGCLPTINSYACVPVDLREFPTYKGTCNGVVTPNECGQVDIEQPLFLNTHPPIDNAQIHVRWMAKDERGQRIVGSTSREFQRVETIADEVCRHARCEGADIIATEDCRTTGVRSKVAVQYASSSSVSAR